MATAKLIALFRFHGLVPAYASILAVLMIHSNAWIASVASCGNDPIAEEVQDADPGSSLLWVRRDGAELVKSGKVIIKLSRGDIVERKAEKNDSLLVVFSGLYRQELDGWISKNDVMSDREAMYYFTKSIETKPDDACAYLSRALVSIYGMDGLKFYNEILKDLNRAIQLAPESALAYVERGTVQEHLHEYELAEKDYSRAIKLAPNAWVIFHLGVTGIPLCGELKVKLFQ